MIETGLFGDTDSTWIGEIVWASGGKEAMDVMSELIDANFSDEEAAALTLIIGGIGWLDGRDYQMALMGANELSDGPFDRDKVFEPIDWVDVLSRCTVPAATASQDL